MRPIQFTDFDGKTVTAWLESKNGAMVLKMSQDGVTYWESDAELHEIALWNRIQELEAEKADCKCHDLEAVRRGRE